MLLVAGLATAAHACPASAQQGTGEPAIGRLLEAPPDLEPDATDRAGAAGRGNDDDGARRSAAARRAPSSSAADGTLPDTGADLRGLTMIGLALLLGGLGARLRTDVARW